MNYNKFIDHTLLRPNALPAEIEHLCEEAKTYDFMSVCVNPFFVPLAKKLLSGTDVKVCTVIGFPLGANDPAIKAAEAKKAVEDGAEEIDMVQNISMAKAHDYAFIEKEIRLIKEACCGKLLKVILETCLLEPEEIRECSLAAKRAGADFVKTSTGFSKGGATVEAVKIMREAVGPEMGVKASGGIHTREQMLALIEAGASRIGASSGVALIQE
ncbi:MAG: deoxyribose-phosphate aldolase [Bacilli bacterium]|nr:deoxyribose-phosphate aldolase [Bacilli bacterium]